MSAPISLATSAGTGSFKPPSTNILSSNLKCINVPGLDKEATIALEILPLSITTFSPVIRSVATALKGILRSYSKLVRLVNQSISSPYLKKIKAGKNIYWVLSSASRINIHTLTFFLPQSRAFCSSPKLKHTSILLPVIALPQSLANPIP